MNIGVGHQAVILARFTRFYTIPSIALAWSYLNNQRNSFEATSSTWIPPTRSKNILIVYTHIWKRYNLPYLHFKKNTDEIQPVLCAWKKLPCIHQRFIILPSPLGLFWEYPLSPRGSKVNFNTFCSRILQYTSWSYIILSNRGDVRRLHRQHFLVLRKTKHVKLR